MIDHLKIGEQEALIVFIVIEYFRLKSSKIQRRNPLLITIDNQEYNAPLDMADEYEHKNYIQPFKLRFERNRLMQVGYQCTNFANSKQFSKSKRSYNKLK